MNQTHINLINKLTPILWEPGHMGAFLGRFLFDTILEQSTLSEKDRKNYNRKDQIEWLWDDITSEYFQYNLTDWKLELHNSWDLLKQRYSKDIDFDAAICYISAQLNYPYYSDAKLLPSQAVKIEYQTRLLTSDLIDMANCEFEFDNITFPYIKSHVQGNIKRINQLPWNKKILCRFPKNKAWMGDVFLFYKHYWYYIINPYSDKNGFMEHNKQALISPVEYDKHFLNNYDRYNPTNDISDYIIIDIYDLIFNENFEQLKAIDSRYNTGVSETQLQLIRETKQELTEILNIFGLSHTSNIVTAEDHASNFLTKEVLDIYNIVKKIGP